VLRNETTLPDQWANVNKLADILDTYCANYDHFDRPKASALGGVFARGGGQQNVTPHHKSANNVASSVPVLGSVKPNNSKPRDLADTVCFKCGKRGHLRVNCRNQASLGQNKCEGHKQTKPTSNTFRCSVAAFGPGAADTVQSECSELVGQGA
jgi:hypothetical protein